MPQAQYAVCMTNPASDLILPTLGGTITRTRARERIFGYYLTAKKQGLKVTSDE